MKKKSLAVNALLNSIKTICTIIFPLITFPYVSRILHVENLGIYNYCTSIISYFTLLAGLGLIHMRFVREQDIEMIKKNFQNLRLKFFQLI